MSDSASTDTGIFGSGFRHGAVLSMIACLAIAFSSGPVAAFQDEDDDDDQDRDERIVVTGSLIARDSNLDSVAPVQTVTREDIALSGQFNMIDVLRNTPALFSSATSEINNNAGLAGSGSGQNTLNLRGLGSTRALTLVDGKRHVSGVQGTQAVEIGSIPMALIERVEVMTGGASALYGADAVSGVVNFITRRDFVGFQLDVRGGMASEGDAEQFTLSGVYGQDFAEGRGNFAIAVDHFSEPGMRVGDRPWSRDNGISRGQANPALRFQPGDITQANTPNFFDFYDFNTTGRFIYGRPIPTSADDFIAAYEAEFGVTPTLTAAELALIQRRVTSPTRAILPQPTFSISSARGLIAPVSWSHPALGGSEDLDGDGVDDCLQSYIGWNSTFIGNGSFGILGGCWVVDDDGSIRTYEDGLVASDFNQFGGDGIQDRFNRNFLIPKENRTAVNLLTTYELTPTSRVTMDAKFVYSGVESGGPLNTFWDLLYGSPENPFLPAELRDLADNTSGIFPWDQDGGLYINRDNIDIGEGISRNQRKTTRVVLGLDGVLDNGFTYEVSANYGRFEREFLNRDFLLTDRWFAAIDVIEDPVTGAPICRSDIDPTPPVTTPFNIPSWNESGFYTFTPGDGQCRPANIWGGIGAISQEAIDFFMVRVVNKDTVTQSVVNATLVGDSAGLFSLPAGPIQFATGVEYRHESSKSEINPFSRGEIPAGAPFAAGTQLEDVSANASLGFDGGNNKLFNSEGSFNVKEVFGEFSVPLMRFQPMVHDLRLDAAFRLSDYSTVGSTNVFQGGIMWSPIRDVRLRGAYSRAVRAPNIFELFSPDQAATFRPVDPCDQAEIAALEQEDPARAATRAANCQADGLPADFEDPLTARFTGVLGGNPDLTEEDATTKTFGILLQPSAIPSLVLSVDYWQVEIDDGISPVSAQDIVNSCYDSPTFPNQFCDLFTRNRDPNSASFLGFNFLRQSQVNFAAIEAEGIDFGLGYSTSIGMHRLSFNAQATKQRQLDFFFDPLDATAVTPRLGMILRPEWAGNVTLGWEADRLAVQWQTRYIGEQALRGVEIDTIDTLFGPAGLADSMMIHGVRAQYRMREGMMLFGGIDNVTDKTPFITEASFPTGPRGRFFFTGLSYRF